MDKRTKQTNDEHSEAVKKGQLWSAMTLLMTELNRQGYYLDALKLQNRGVEWMLMLTVFKDDLFYIGFHKAREPIAGLIGFYAKVVKEEVRWKPDKYRNEIS